MKSLTVGVIGPLNIDMIIRGEAPSDFEKLLQWGGSSEINLLLAGAVGYFSQNLAKLGVNVHLVSAIADDPLGSLLKESVQAANINASYLSVEKEKKSAIGVYMLLFGGAKRPITYRLPTHNGFPPVLTPNQNNHLLSSDLIHCGGLLHFRNLWNSDVVQLFAAAKKKNKITSLDAQFPLDKLDPPWLNVLQPILKNTDIWFMDEAEALGMTGEKNLDQAMETLKGLSIPVVVVKLGERGAMVLSQENSIIQPAITPKNFVDSIGAGDSFDAGFLYAYLQGNSLKQSARFAALVASRSCEGIGGSTTFPDFKEVAEFFK